MATTSRDRRPGTRSPWPRRGRGVRVHPALRRSDRRAACCSSCRCSVTTRRSRTSPAPASGARPRSSSARPARSTCTPRPPATFDPQEIGVRTARRRRTRRSSSASTGRRRCRRAATRRSRTTPTTSPERRWRGSRSPSRATYELQVRGDSTDTWAAVGRDPSDNVDKMRRGAIIVAAIGVVLGGLLLALAGWRSKRASTPSIPEGPGWDQRPGRRRPCAPGHPSRPGSRRCRSTRTSPTRRRSGTAAATAAGAGARQRGAATIAVGAAATRGRPGAHRAARTGGARPPA